MSEFELFIGIDYSGARTSTSRLAGLRVYAARLGREAAEPWASPTSSSNGQPVHWTRRGARFPWMVDMAERGALPRDFEPPLTSAEEAVTAKEGWILGVT